MSVGSTGEVRRHGGAAVIWQVADHRPALRDDDELVA